MEQPKIGVYVCDCGVNIAATVNVPEVVKFASGLPNVTVAREYKYMCSEPGQKMIKEDIQNLGLNRVVVAACSPRMHEPTFQNAVSEAGENPYHFAMANIREHVSWICKDVPAGTEKAKRLVNATVMRVALQTELFAAQGAGDARGDDRRRRHRGHPGGAHHRGCGLQGLPGRAGAVHRRAHGPTGQDLPHARL